jgi:hypothetical protein
MSTAAAARNPAPALPAPHTVHEQPFEAVLEGAQ